MSELFFYDKIPFVATQLPDIGLWLDASDASTITESGGLVSQWDDKSGNAIHRTQGTGANQPITNSTSQNGLNTVDFDGVAHFMNGAGVGISGSGAGTVFVVSLPQGTGTADDVWQMGANTGAGSAVRAADTTTNATASGFRFNNGSKLFASPFDGNHQLATWQWADGANYGEHELYVGGVLQAQDSSTNPSVVPNITDDEFIVGAGRTSSATIANFFNGQIAEIIVCNRVLTASEQASVENYLVNKWSVPFVPTSFEGLGLWLDGDDFSTITESSNLVSQWDDGSGNTNNTVQATGTNQPLYNATGMNNKGSIDFSPIDEGLVATAAATIDDVWSGGGTLCMAINLNDDGGFAAGRLISKDKWQMLSVQESGGALKIQMNVTTSGTDGQWLTTDRDITVGGNCILTITYDSDIIATAPVFRLNGTVLALSVGSAPTGAYTTDVADDLVVGNLAALNRGMDGFVGEVALYDRTLSAEEITAFEFYLSRKWSI